MADSYKMAAKRGEVKCLQWDVTSITKAVEAVKIHDKGLRQAAREHGVPITTLKSCRFGCNRPQARSNNSAHH